MIIPSNTRVPILSEEGVSKTYKILYLWVSNPIFVCVLYYFIIYTNCHTKWQDDAFVIVLIIRRVPSDPQKAVLMSP